MWLSFLVVDRLPTVYLCRVLALVLPCWVGVGCQFPALLATLLVVLFFLSIPSVVLMRTAFFPSSRSSVLYRLPVWDIIPSTTLQKSISFEENCTRPQPSSTSNGRLKRKYRNDRRHRMFTWKPKLGKNHRSPSTLNFPLNDESYNQGVGGNNLALYLFANKRLQ